MSTGDFPEIMSQRILVGIILVGRLGVQGHYKYGTLRTGDKETYARKLSAPVKKSLVQKTWVCYTRVYV